MILPLVISCFGENFQMTNVNGRTGASGLADAARSLADALVVILVPGLLTTSCLTLAAADSSV